MAKMDQQLHEKGAIILIGVIVAHLCDYFKE
jgi:hypothetical protein